VVVVEVSPWVIVTQILVYIWTREPVIVNGYGVRICDVPITALSTYSSDGGVGKYGGILQDDEEEDPLLKDHHVTRPNCLYAVFGPFSFVTVVDRGKFAKVVLTVIGYLYLWTTCLNHIQP
jgi:hypothetical protein